MAAARVPDPPTLPPERPHTGVSGCLLGEPVRVQRRPHSLRFLSDVLAPHVEWVHCCPEIAIGLGSARETLRPTVRGRQVNRAGSAGHTAGATRGRHANALLRALGRISDLLDRARRQDLSEQTGAYRHGHLPLSVPVALLAHYASTAVAPWLASQTYLDPSPGEFGLCHHLQ